MNGDMHEMRCRVAIPIDMYYANIDLPNLLKEAVFANGLVDAHGSLPRVAGKSRRADAQVLRLAPPPPVYRILLLLLLSRAVWLTGGQSSTAGQEQRMPNAKTFFMPTDGAPELRSALHGRAEGREQVREKRVQQQSMHDDAQGEMAVDRGHRPEKDNAERRVREVGGGGGGGGGGSITSTITSAHCVSRILLSLLLLEYRQQPQNHRMAWLGIEHLETKDHGQ
ncbi:hypothetical protein CMUS01_05366 [Colletotrichum musicola]|uniref:Uncharacterized protein n=1 Tax=Colletotrichum musicola TaxID=2175873 RepID=A0A8H6KSI5_9PEZI|nr:hypothetical protein CMUS01_05366 [Colletotrichum musicola]